MSLENNQPIFDGFGEFYSIANFNTKISQDRAVLLAKLNAHKKIAIYLKFFYPKLSDNEISALINNIIEIASDITCNSKEIPLDSNQILIFYSATLKYTVNRNKIYDWINLFDDNQKLAVIRKNSELHNAITENFALAESLIEKFILIDSQTEKNNLKEQINRADQDFFAIQKFLYDLKHSYPKIYRESAKIKPNYYLTYNNLGNKFYYSKQYDEAITNYDMAIQLNPNFIDSYYNRGSAYYHLGQYHKAFQDFNKVIELNPNDSLAYNMRGLVYHCLWESEQALQDFNKAIELNPNFAEAYRNRGDLYNDGFGQYEQAIQDFNKAIELNPKCSEAYNGRGIAYSKLNQNERAIQDYNRAIQLNPNDDWAYNNRGVSYMKLKQYEQAIADYSKAIELNPNHATAYSNRADTYSNLNKNEEALQDYEKIFQLVPDCSFILYISYAQVCLSLKQYEKAFKAYDKLLRDNPNNYFALTFRGNAYKKLEKYDLAIEDYNKVIEINHGEEPVWYHYRGECYQALGEEQKAQDDFWRARCLGYRNDRRKF